MIKMFVIPMILTLLPALVMASDGTDVGNGGDAVVCRNRKSQITSVQVYDHYEAKEKRKLTLDLGNASLTYEKKIDLLLTRIQRINPNRAKLYRTWSSSFFQDATFVSGKDLIDIPDTGGGYVPVGCKLEQLAVQQIPRLPGDSRYTVNKDLWDKMDADGKAGLVLHELILRELTSPEYGQTNSINARYYNAIVSTKDFEKMSLKNYFSLMQLLEFKVADAQLGVPVLVYEPDETKLNGTPESPIFYNEDVIESAANVVDMEFDYMWNGQVLKVGTSWMRSPVKFYPNGLLRSLMHIKSLPIYLPILGQSLLAGNHGETGWLTLYENGAVASAYGMDLTLNLPAFRGTATSISLDSDGKITEVFLSSREPNKAEIFIHGRWYPISGSSLKFDKNQNPQYDDQTLDVIDGKNHLKCSSAKFDTKDNLVFCSQAQGTWAAGDGKVWEVIGLRNTTFFENGRLKSFFTDQAYQNNILNFDLGGKYIELYPSGGIKSIDGKGKIKINGYVYEVESVELTENGEIIRFEMARFGCANSQVSLKTQQDPYILVTSCEETFLYPSGDLKQATLAVSQTLTTKTGPRRFLANALIQWDIDGYAVQP